MKLELDCGPGQYRIRAYTPAGIVVNDQTLTRSCIVMPDRLVIDWPPQSFSELSIDHFAMVAALRPELVLFGSGPLTRFPQSALLAPLRSLSIGFEAMDTAAACRSYSVLMAEGRRVAAALLMIAS